MSRQRRKNYWPQAAGLSAVSVVTQVTTAFVSPFALVGDTVLLTPNNAAAAALEGNAAGVFATVTADGTVTITHAAAAGGELWHVVVIPQGMSEL
jgi:hypothetical protein